MKKKILAVMMALAMTASLAACGSQGDAGADADAASTAEASSTAASGAAEASSSGNKTIVIDMGSGFSTLDPGYVYETNPPLIINACYQTLFHFEPGSDEPSGLLASEYTFSDDAKDLTIKINPDAKFASGNDVTSADVAFSLNRCKNLKGNPSFICDNFESIETPDDDTVIIHQAEPDSSVLAKLCYASTAVVDSKVVKENGGTDAEDASTADKAQAYLNTTSAGSGQFILKSYKTDEEVLLERNPNYWGDDATNVDAVNIQLTDDSNAQMMGLSSGDVDIAMNLNEDTIGELESAENVTTDNTSSKTVAFIMMNEDESLGGPVSNVKVQQAIKYAVDYAGIQSLLGTGSTTPKSIIQVGFMGSAGELDASTATDLDKAKSLMEEAGYADGFKIDMPVCELDVEGVPLLDLAQKVKEDLSKINIDVNIVQQNWAGGYGDDYRNGKLGFTVMYWGIDYNDPDVQLAFLAGQTVGLRAGWQAEGNEATTDLMTKILAETDNDARSDLLQQLQTSLEESCPFIMIGQAPCHIGYNNRLTGVEFSDTTRIDLNYVNIK